MGMAILPLKREPAVVSRFLNNNLIYYSSLPAVSIMDSQTSVGSSGMVRRYDYSDRTVVAADFGPTAAEVSVDVVDGTAIIVVGDEQTEIALPEGDGEAFNRNGVVTIEVRQ